MTFYLHMAFLLPIQLIDLEFKMSKALCASMNFMVPSQSENSFKSRLFLQNLNASATD